PGGPKRYKWYLNLMPAAIERLDLSEYDLVISDSSAFAKGVVTNPDTLHICYCHSPTRYLWSDTHSYTEDLRQPTVVKQLLPIILNRLRVWDRLAADRVDRFIANSETVQRRIEKFYRAESEVIFPPVDISGLKPVPVEEVSDYYLLVSRLRPYKRVDLAIKAFNSLSLPLKIVGMGEEYEKLKAMAGKNIEFLGPVNNEERNELLSHCKAFIHPQEEDFGIAALEAMAAGRPVIAYGKGGARETVVDGQTGILFDDQTPWDLVDVVRDFDYTAFDPAVIRAHAEKFSTEIFTKNIQEYIEREFSEFRSKHLSDVSFI
ncbi:MAG: glycosyltransferase, partial [Candidatus Andersenbacteria bacterium]|nr:glycosyltransferase [Candidatus Andersenbacteria bacterium]